MPGRCKAPFYSINYFIHYLPSSGLLDILSIICCFIQCFLFLSGSLYLLFAVLSVVLSVIAFYPLLTFYSYLRFYPMILVFIQLFISIICSFSPSSLYHLLFLFSPLFNVYYFDFISYFIHYFLFYLLLTI